MRSLFLLIVVTLIPAYPATGQDPAMSADVRWHPQKPVQGSFVFVIVRVPDESGRNAEVAVTGNLAGQPLHFERDRLGEHRALAPIPVNARATLPLQLSVQRGRNTGHRVVQIGVQPGNYRMERLTVSSRFTTPPDSALEARIRRESARSGRVSRQTHTTPRLWSGEFVRPRPSRITSEFGTGRVFNGQLRSRHMGVDFDGEVGDPIRAANRGVVAVAGDFYYAGKVVYLDHGAGLVTIYMHMSAVDVEEGQVVERGHVLGKVGATGRVTGPHTHWVARYGRVSVNGLSLFDLDVAPLAEPPSPPVEPAER
jgi:murein DD-endopeptidase MepM/ murein hydrolase activator NlpD